MRFAITTLFAFTLALVFSLPSVADGQCCSTPYTVGYAPVQTAAPAVYQTTYYDGWYPGKYAINFTRNLFGAVTQPMYGTPYTAGYAPAASPYTVGYAPRTVAYRPTYPVTYGPVVQTVSRPVVLSPVTSCSTCNPCGTCDSCCGTTQAAYYSSSSSSCTNCSPSTSVYSDEPASRPTYEPQPALGPSENPAGERSLFESNKPELDSEVDSFEAPSLLDGDEAYFQAPPLFKPQDRLTSRNPAPVWNAVHRTPAEANNGQSTTAAKPVAKRSSSHQIGATGWGSSAR